MEHFQTCTVLKLLFHWSPLICPSIVFRDGGIVMSQSLLFSQPITNNLSNGCRLPVPFTCPAAVQIYWNKRKFYQKRSTPTGIVLYTNMAAVHWFGHQYCERDVLWKRLCSRIGPSDSFPRNYLLSQAQKNSSSRLPTSRAQNSRRRLKKTQFTIFTETIMHLVPPPPHQICVTIVFNFRLDGFNT